MMSNLEELLLKVLRSEQQALDFYWNAHKKAQTRTGKKFFPNWPKRSNIINAYWKINSINFPPRSKLPGIRILSDLKVFFIG